MKKSRIEALDILRGLASLGVAVMHCYYLLGLKTSFPQADILVSHFGTLVYLFFIVSGISMVLSQENSGLKIRSFLTSRFFRIFPLFYFAIVATFVSLKFVGIDTSFYNFGTLFWNITLLFNLSGKSSTAESLVGAGWTVGVEVIFYFLFISICKLRLKNLFFAFLASLTLSVVMRLNWLNITDNPEIISYTILYSFLVYLPMFIVGMILCKRPRGWKSATVGRYALLTSIFITFLILKFDLQQLFVLYIWIVVYLLQTLWALNVKLKDNFLKNILIYLGKISYSTYILHSFLLLIYSKAISLLFPLSNNSSVLQSFLLIVTFIILLICLSSLTYKYIEVPCMRIGKRLVNRLNLEK